MVKISKLGNISHLDSKKYRCAIYSVDFQPQGWRIATGGGDCTAKIWNVSTILKGENGSNTTGLLATLDVGEGTVNTIKWSHCGTMLAFGNERHILIYCLNPRQESSHSFGSRHEKNKENWIRLYSLQGHAMDINDIDWSPCYYESNDNNDKSSKAYTFLASGSIDNRVNIWKVGVVDSTVPGAISSSMLVPYQTLSGHNSFVKGVAFDVTGRFLASIGSDNIVNVWENMHSFLASSNNNEKSNSFVLANKITGCLDGASDKSLFRRSDWAPDGASLCISSAVKKLEGSFDAMGKPVGSIVKRCSWYPLVDLVGHETPITVSSFCPSLLSGNDKNCSSLVCLGDLTGVISVWNTLNNKAIISISDLFDNSVTDVSWCTAREKQDGFLCAACSLDGYVSIIAFSTNELGVSAQPDVLDDHFAKIYGVSFSEMVRLNGGALRPKAMPPSLDNGQSISAVVAPSAFSKPVTVLAQQTQVTVNGKKRITPVLVSVDNTQNIPVSSTPAAGISTIPETATVDRERETLVITPVEKPGNINKRTRSAADLMEGRAAFGSHPSGSALPPAAKASRSLISSNIGLSSDAMANRVIVDMTSSNNNLVEVKSVQCLYSLVKDYVNNTLRFIPNLKSSQSNSKLTGRVIDHSSVLTADEVFVGSGNFGKQSLSKIQLSQPNSNEIIWETAIPGGVIALAGVFSSRESNYPHRSSLARGSGVCVLGCEDGSLYILNMVTGLRTVIPPMVLPGAIVRVDCKYTADHGLFHILALTSNSQIFLWSVREDDLRGNAGHSVGTLSIVAGNKVPQSVDNVGKTMNLVINTSLSAVGESILSSVEGPNPKTCKCAVDILDCHLATDNSDGIPSIVVVTQCRGRTEPHSRSDGSQYPPLLQVYTYEGQCQCWLRSNDSLSTNFNAVNIQEKLPESSVKLQESLKDILSIANSAQSKNGDVTEGLFFQSLCEIEDQWGMANYKITKLLKSGNVYNKSVNTTGGTLDDVYSYIQLSKLPQFSWPSVKYFCMWISICCQNVSSMERVKQLLYLLYNIDHSIENGVNMIIPGVSNDIVLQEVLIPVLRDFASGKRVSGAHVQADSSLNKCRGKVREWLEEIELSMTL